MCVICGIRQPSASGFNKQAAVEEEIPPPLPSPSKRGTLTSSPLERDEHGLTQYLQMKIDGSGVKELLLTNLAAGHAEDIASGFKAKD